MNSFEDVWAGILEDQDITTFSLITAQLILHNVRPIPRAQQLRDRAAVLSPGGKLIVDVPHPMRRVRAIYIASQTSRSEGPAFFGTHTCRVLATDVIWDKYRDYADELAKGVDLIIANPKLAHLLFNELKDRVWVFDE